MTGFVFQGHILASDKCVPSTKIQMTPYVQVINPVVFKFVGVHIFGQDELQSMWHLNNFINSNYM